MFCIKETWFIIMSKYTNWVILGIYYLPASHFPYLAKIMCTLNANNTSRIKKVGRETSAGNYLHTHYVCPLR